MKNNSFIDIVSCYVQMRFQRNHDLSDEVFERCKTQLIKNGLDLGTSDTKLKSVFSGIGQEEPATIAHYGEPKDELESIQLFLKDCQALNIEGVLFDQRVFGMGKHHFHTLAAPLGSSSLDVSLFSFFKISAAFLEVESAGLGDQFALVGCDLSGLQNFLYDIVSKHAAKNLKGRSFYLQLLVEDILLEIGFKHNIKPWQILYSSGGGFYIISSLSENLDLQLAEIQMRRNMELFKAHGSALFVALDYVPIKIDDTQGTKIGGHWKELSAKLNRAKAARYRMALIDNFNLFFEISNSAEPRVDHITGREIRDNGIALKLKTGEETEDRTVSQHTKDQIDLGRKLKDSDYWVTTRAHKPATNGYTFQVPGSSLYHSFGNTEQLDIPRMENMESTISVATFHPDKYLEATPYGYGGNKYPTIELSGGENVNATFDQFAHSAGDEIDRLGVLRMDVDNLGSSFINGFRERVKVFNLYSELSMRLDDFFTDEINALIAKNDRFKSSLFVIYSGGDDLFAVGNWNVLIEFATEVKDKFMAYIGGDFLTLSGGLTFVTSKYPILKAAEFAGLAEARAKSFVRSSNDSSGSLSKSALDIFGTPVGWEEFDSLEKWRDQWLGWFEQNAEGLNKALLHKLFDYRKLKNQNDSLKWQWHAAYNVARRSKDSNKEGIEKLKRLLFKGENNYRELDLCCLGGRWADYLTRNKQN